MSISVSPRTALLAGGFLVALVAWWLWPTETRAVASAINHLEEAAEAADWQDFMTGVSPSFNHEGVTYDDLRVMGQSLATMLGPCTVYVLRKQIKVQASRASAHVVFFGTADGPDARLRGTGRMVWQLSFRKERGQWLVTKAIPVDLPYVRRHISNLQDIRDYLGI